MNNRTKTTVRIVTLLLLAVFALTNVAGISQVAQSAAALASADKVVVKDITDGAQSLTDDYALTNNLSSSTFAADEEVWVIVKFLRQSVLDSALKYNESNTQEYIKSPAAIAQAEGIAAYQDNFIAKYSSAIQEVSYRYSVLFNGISVRVRYGDIARLEADPTVQQVIISERYQAPLAVTLNEVSVDWTGIYDPGDVGYDGTGTVIAVLDTGLDYTHQAFANQPTGELALGKDKVSSLLSGLTATAMMNAKDSELTADALYKSDKVPFQFDYADVDADVYPVEDHGTHVAGIIAGKDDVITGIATNAQLAIMKVFSNTDTGATNEAILAALNDCVVLGVDAINMSLGSSCGFARERDDDAVNEIYDQIRATGICLICAAGNEYSSAMQSTWGDTNLTTNPDSGTVGSPSSYEASMSVASISGVKTKYLMVNGEQEVYYTESSHGGTEKNDFAAELLQGATSKEFQYVVVPGLGTESNYYDLDVNGKIAVVKRGSTNFEEKVEIAASKGAVGVIIYNNVSGTISMTIGKAMLPACSISMDLGKYFEAHTTGTLVVDTSYLAGPFMSDFSSWGPLPNLEFKPDITAHGGDIYSAVRGGYDTYSGTSMASPNMAGATILVRQYVKERFPQLSPYEVTEMTYQLIMSTATIAYNEDGNPYSPRKQGAGLADIGKSVNTQAYLYVDGTNKPKLSLGDDPTKMGIYKMVFKVRNIGENALTYELNPLVMTETLSSDNKTVAQKSYMLSDTAMKVECEDGGYVTGNTLTVPGYSTAEVSVTLTLSSAAKRYIDRTFANGMYVEGFIELLSKNPDNINLNIGYLGFYGDWRVAPMLDADAYEVGRQQDDPSILEEDKLQPDVYATLPQAGFRLSSAEDAEESYYGMGQFGYRIADGYTEPAILEEKASLTANMDGSFSLSIIAAGLLRSASVVHMQICDAVTGEQIWAGDDYNCRKSNYSGGRRAGAVMVDFRVPDYNLPNNSRYRFTMQCELDWPSSEGNLNDTYEFEFYIDNEAPVVVEDKTQVRIEGNGANKTYWLDVFVYDNHYIQGYSIGTFSSLNSDGSYNDQLPFHNYIIPLADGRRNGETRISYNITEYWSEIWQNGGNIYLSLIDYAKNDSVFQLTLPSSLANSLSFRSTMRQANTYVNEMIDLKDSLVTTPNQLWVKDLKWWVDDEQVAAVRDGVLLGLSAGSTTLHVSNKDGSAEATLPVTVRDARYEDIRLTKIELNKTSATVERGEEFELSVSLLPHDTFADLNLNFGAYNLVWTAGGVAQFVTTDARGNEVFTNTIEGAKTVKVRALNSGSATISVRDTLSQTRVNASCSVYVKSEFEMEGTILRSYTGRGDANGVVEIPEDLNAIYIYSAAFMNNPYITKIIVPEGVEQIYEAGIYGCDNLEEVVLPQSMKTLDRWAIAWNPKLTKVEMGGVKSVGEMAFVMDEALVDIDLSNVFSIGGRAFMFCDSLKKVNLTNCKSMDMMAFALCTGLEEIVTSETTPIGDYGFYGDTSLTEIELNGNYVGEFGFAECTGLRSVTFNNAVDTLALGAFYDCTSLSEAIYRSTVRVIDYAAFAGNAFTTVYLPAGLEKLGRAAYGRVSMYVPSYITDVVISAGAKLTDIDLGPFDGCSQLSAFTVEEGNAYLSSSNGILYDKAQRTVMLVPSGYSGLTLNLPETVTTIGKNSFAGTSVTTVVGRSVTRVEDGAFYLASITNLTLGPVDYVGTDAFYGSFLNSWPSCFNSIRYIGDEAFRNTRVSGTITLPETLEHLGDFAFGQTQITGINLPDSLKELGGYVFTRCDRLANVDLGEGIEKIGDFAFAYCPALRSIVLPDSVKEVGYGAFGYCTALQSVTLSENLSAIADYMFVNCTALQSINLPKSVTKIGEAAFAVIAADDATLTNGRIRDINLDNVEEIGDVAFFYAPFTSLVAPNLKKLGSRSFAYSSLQSVSLPAIEEVGGYAFFSCTRLSSVDVTNATTIGEYAFAGCTALTELDLSGATTVGDFALYSATRLQLVTFDKLETLGSAVFAGSGITTLNLPASFSNYTVQTFFSASRLREVTVDEDNQLYFTDSQGALYKDLPNGLVLVYFPMAKNAISFTAEEKTIRVESYAFAGNTSLQTINLPERLQVLGAGAFYGCSSLKTINLECVAAPVLESYYSASGGGINNHFVNTFQTSTGSTVTSADIIYPSNGTGYDGYVWQRYFSENLLNIGAVKRSASTLSIQDQLEAMDVNALTLDDIANVVLMRKTYTSFDSDQKNFLSGVIGKLSLAENKVVQLLIAEIDSLPANPSYGDAAKVSQLRQYYASLSGDMQQQVTNESKLAEAEKKIAELPPQDDGEIEPANPSDGIDPAIWIVAAVTAVLCIAVVVYTAVVIKKIKTAQKSENEEKESGDNE